MSTLSPGPSHPLGGAPCGLLATPRPRHGSLPACWGPLRTAGLGGLTAALPRPPQAQPGVARAAAVKVSGTNAREDASPKPGGLSETVCALRSSDRNGHRGTSRPLSGCRALAPELQACPWWLVGQVRTGPPALRAAYVSLAARDAATATRRKTTSTLAETSTGWLRHDAAHTGRRGGVNEPCPGQSLTGGEGRELPPRSPGPGRPGTARGGDTEPPHTCAQVIYGGAHGTVLTAVTISPGTGRQLWVPW